MTGVFAENVVAYAQAGWPCVLPVPPVDKTPPPPGFTGAEGRDTDPLDLVRFVGTHPDHSIALRMPEGVIGIDVDQYVKKGKQKHGARTLAALIERHGPLPATWCSTARGSDAGPGESRILLFRVPAQRYVTRLSATHPDGSTTGDIEIIQRHHRYAVVWPSQHGEAGTYRWYDPDGHPVDAPPKPEELTELPEVWVAALAEGAASASPASADHASGQHLLDQLEADHRPECADVTSARQVAVDALSRADEGSRHDVMTERVYHLIQLAAHGHPGVGPALLDVRTRWERLTAGEDRAEELERALLTAARKAVTVVGTNQVPRDPCLMMAGGFPLPAPPVGDPGAGDPDLQIVVPPRWASAREILGTHAFDPNAGMDQTLAEKVLERTYPAMRYAYDSKGWLLRLPERWELHGRLTPWAVAQVASLMPIGDPTAEKGSDQQDRSARRARLMSTAGARAVAGKMDDLVCGGMHPASVALSELDSDPEVMWAGGVPWSLRNSVEAPTPSQLDPSVPHLHTAAVAPQTCPTPLWDAFLEAVWPDPALRVWAVRVLSVAMTGYSDRALPILLGETGRGKTQVVALMMSVLGSYAHAANPKLLSATTNEHDTIVFDLKGRRLSFIDEAPSEAKAGQERLKQLTGGGELTGRRMNQDPVTFAPTHTFVLTANDEPTLTDPAVRSRVRLLPCEGDPEAVRATRAAIGHVSGPEWRREAPGVLAALMREAGGWLADPTTAHVESAPEHARYLAEHLGAEQDPVVVWVAEETEPFDQGTPSRELYQAFTASCLRNNLRRDAIPSETKWGRTLTRLGFASFPDGRHKIRRLRVRSGGFLPGMGPLPGLGSTTRQPTRQDFPADPKPPSPSVETAGFDGPTAGFVPGSDTQPGSVFPQVNPSESVKTAGFAGLKKEDGSHTHTHTRGGPGSGNAPNPAGDPSVSEPPGYNPKRATGPENVDDRTNRHGCVRDPSWRDEHARELAERAAEVKAKKPRSAEATAKAAALRAEKRSAAIVEASGDHIGLPAMVLRDGTVRPISADDVDQLLATIDWYLTVDVETTGFPVGHEHFALRTVQLGNEHFAVVLDPTDHADAIRRHLAAAQVLQAHSATADLVPLADAGLVDHEDAWSRMHDTVTAAKLADPASTGSDPGLKKISAAMLGDLALSPSADAARAALFKAGKWLTDTRPTTALERSGWAQVDPACETMVRYAASDVLDDAAIACRLPQPDPAVMDRERTVQRMTARVAYHGLRIDGDHTETLLAEHTARRTEAAALVRELSDGQVANPGSGPQVAAALEALGATLPRTATGRPSVAEGVLDPLRNADGPAGSLASAVLEYRHHDTAIGTFLEPYQQLVRNGDGRARPTVYTLGADTGRMSCVRPNLQQVPREGGFRACITADPGELLVSADFAGVELRVAAALSGDANLSAILADPDRDVHWEVARLVFGPNATKADRYAVKRGVFGRIYGGGVRAIARGVGVNEAVAQTIIDALDAMCPDLTAWSRLVREGVDAGRAQFRTYSGRVVHLDPQYPHKAPNYCIQGTARELLVDALMRWRETRWGDAVLLPVHDELVVRVPEDQAGEATAQLEAVMTSELFGIPIKAEASDPSYSWRDSS